MLFGSKKTLQHDRLLVRDERTNCESPWWVTGSADKVWAKASKRNWTQTHMRATTHGVLSKCVNRWPSHPSSFHKHTWHKTENLPLKNNLFMCLYLPHIVLSRIIFLLNFYFILTLCSYCKLEMPWQYKCPLFFMPLK